MKNEIDEVFRRLKHQRKKALIAYLAAGYPAFRQERPLIELLMKSGVDLLELGVPFSDPIADGPTIQFASQQSLESGTTVKKILSWVSSLKKDLAIPVILMSYLNPILAFGLDRFSRAAHRAGVSGLIIPDLIPEEGRTLETAFKRNGLHLIYMVSPTTPRPRHRMISKKTRGFLYAVSVAGVTGARKGFSNNTRSWLSSLRTQSGRPVCVGFGISAREHIRKLKSGVDGFIVGSALIDRIRSSSRTNRFEQVKKFILPLAKECHHGR